MEIHCLWDNVYGRVVEFCWQISQVSVGLGWVSTATQHFLETQGSAGCSWGNYLFQQSFFFSTIESEMVALYSCGTVYDRLIWIYVREEGSEDIRILCLWQLEGAEGLCGLFSLDMCFFYRTSHQTFSSSGRLVYRSTKRGFPKGLSFNTRGTCTSQEEVICTDKTLGNTSKWQLYVPWQWCCTKKSVN